MRCRALGRSPFVWMMTALALAGLLSGCGGGGGGGGALGLGLPFFPGDQSPIPALGEIVAADGSLLTGSIDFNQDIDFFRFNTVAGVTYGLTFVDVINAQAGFPASVTFDITSTNGTTVTVASSASLANLPFADGERRIVFTATTSQTHFLRITHQDFNTGRGSYGIVLSSSQRAKTGYVHRLLNNRDVVVFDSMMAEIDRQAYVFDPFNPLLSLQANFSEQTDPGNVQGLELITRLQLPREFFLPMAMTPEFPEIHLHIGNPNLMDSRLDASGSSDRNDNRLVSDPADPHPSIAAIPFPGSTGGTVTLTVPGDVWHTISGHEFYIDIHVTSDTMSVPAPLTSTPQMAGLFVFESEFRMTSDQVPAASAPPGGLTNANDITILYDQGRRTFSFDVETVEMSGLFFDDFAFFGDMDTTPVPWVGAPAEEIRPNPHVALVGLPIHIHAGSPGTVGPVVINLGTVPPPLDDTLAPFFLPRFDTTRGLKNIVNFPAGHVPAEALSDAEASALRSLLYPNLNDHTGGQAMGWYIDIENGAGQTLVRADAHFFPDARGGGYRGQTRDPGVPN